MDLANSVDRIKNTPGLFRDVVAVVVCVAVGLTCSVYILSHQSLTAPWTEKYKFSAVFDQAPGVSPSALQEVRVAGVPVGRITKASTTKSGQAKLQLSIDPDQTVYSDARLVLTTKAPLNIMYVTLDPGTPASPRLPENGTIPLAQTRRAVQPYEVLDKLDTSTRAALTSLLNETDVVFADSGQQLPGSIDATRDAMTSFKPVLDQLAKRRENLSRLVHSLSSISRAVGDDDKRLGVLTDSAHQTLQTVASRDDKLTQTLQELPGFTDDLDGAMTTVDNLTNQLDPTLTDLDNASGKLPKAVNSLTGSVKAIHHFIDVATPVVNRAGPVVADLRPFSVQANKATASLYSASKPIPAGVSDLVSWQPADRAAGRLPWLDDLGAFVYNTSSSFSLMDANGGLGRANVTVDLTNPAGGLADVGEQSKNDGPGTAQPQSGASDNKAGDDAAGEGELAQSIQNLVGSLFGNKGAS
ncbi:MAG: Mammalian cell entry related domain protein [Aeromicrobium sp.]|nr:Mammalian cell entry related domain protein [Aeromicrobium sp.]